MITVRADLCPQNHSCPSLYVCPTGALVQIGHKVPKVIEADCIDCSACTQTCPVFVDSRS
jgi:Fe-S-cluster-containing hydrogenase component 2